MFTKKNFLFKPGGMVTRPSYHPHHKKWAGIVIDTQFRSKIVEESKMKEKVWSRACFPKKYNKDGSITYVKYDDNCKDNDPIYVRVLGKCIYYHRYENELGYIVFVQTHLQKLNIFDFERG